MLNNHGIVIEICIIRVLLFVFCFFYMSCSSSLTDFEEEMLQYDRDSTSIYYNYSIDTISNRSQVCQSAAVYADYAFLVKDRLSSIAVFSMKENKVIKVISLSSHNELNANNGVIYHCNQSTFGSQRYQNDDYFPLLYVSQRNNFDKRCFVNVLRIEPEFSDQGTITSFSVSEVQTIYLPVMNRDNALGNANLVFDPTYNRFIAYSRNNNPTDNNYQKCRISYLPIPDKSIKEVYYEDSDILDSYEIASSALNMQGATLYNGDLFIGQGYQSIGYINVLRVSLEKRKLIENVDLLLRGFTLEPEGFFCYDNKIMFTASSKIFCLTMQRE